ncbi:MAG: Ig-like domain-containing protein [Eubacteriales bacterium]|nr:Ig-like domain-containing protein [Eubacteriales bacterium]
MKKIKRLLLGITLALVLVSTAFSSLPGMDLGTIEVEAAKKPAISKKSLTLYVKQTATLKMKNVKGKVTWSSSNKKIAKVTSKGKVTAVKSGKATIKAKVKGKTYKCTVKVINPTLSKTSSTIFVGGKDTLSVSGAVGAVSWSSSAPAIATVNAAGVVTGVRAGTATIKALASGIRLNCTVTVKQPPVVNVSSIALNKTNERVEVGNTLQLTATIAPANANNKAVSWSSSNTNIATVDANGLVKAIAGGSATITAKTADGGKTANCVITTYINETGVSLTVPRYTLSVGETENITANVSPSNATNKNVTFSSSDSSVLTVDNTGKVTAIKDGTATITAKTNNLGKTASCTITVKTMLEAIMINDDAEAIALDAGKDAQLTYKTVPASIPLDTITYSSDNEDVATVDGNGRVVAKKSGAANVTVKAKDNYGTEREAVIKINVTTRVESIQLNTTSTNIYVGSTHTIIPTVLPDEASNKGVSYSSSDNNIAKVNDSGVVTGVAVGQATITVTSKDSSSITASLEVTVKDADSTTANVASKEDLDAALSNENISIVNISTTDSLNLTIEEGDYSSVSLIINAPNGHIVNKAKFKDITIKAISPSTFVEMADGNIINYEAPTGSVTISEGAISSINVLDGAEKLNLEVDGTLSSLVIATPDTEINVHGDTAQLSVPVKVTAEATDTTIKTSNDLNINAETPISLDVQKGGQNTSITVDNQSSMPSSVTGLGQIQVKVQDTNTIETIVADSSKVETTESYPINGMVKDSSNQAVSGAKVSVIPYSADITEENIAEYAAKEGIITTVTKEDGSYTTDAVTLGNYYIYITKNDYLSIIDTFILIEKSDAQAKNFTMVSESEGLGSISGVLIDAQSGDPVVEGITVYIRKGSNNISGPAIASTSTNSEGKFTFSNLEPGQYTIQAVDQREDVEGYYISVSFNTVVNGGETTTVSNSITGVLTSDQVRFVLSWGKEESGASSDLDSHLIGPAANENGQFHTWYSDRIYSDYSGDTVTRYADLDVDDTDYEGPETTTIYVKTEGIYHFYIHDFSNGGNPTSDQMSRSSAVVKAYIGDKLLATYSCPNQAGNLWYVCDYDSKTNRFISKNIVSGFYDDESNIGVDLLEKYQKLLTKVIGELEVFVSANPDYELPEDISIAEAKNLLNTSTDYAELSRMYYKISDFLEQVYHNLYITDVRMYESGSDINHVLYYDDYYSDEFDSYVLEIAGDTDTLCDTLEFDVEGSSTYTIAASNRSGYDKMVIVKNEYGMTRTFYIDYEQTSVGLYIEGVDAEDDECNSLINDWHIDDSEGYDILYIKGFTPTLPETLAIYPEYGWLVSVSIQASDRSDYEKMVVLSYGTDRRTYYIQYEQNIPLYIGRVTALNADGEDIIDGCWYADWEYDEDDNEYDILYIESPAASLPENLLVTPRYADYGVTATIVASDRDGYEKMVVLSCGENVRKYYIIYYGQTSYDSIEEEERTVDIDVTDSVEEQPSETPSPEVITESSEDIPEEATTEAPEVIVETEIIDTNEAE